MCVSPHMTPQTSSAHRAGDAVATPVRLNVCEVALKRLDPTSGAVRAVLANKEEQRGLVLRNVGWGVGQGGGDRLLHRSGIRRQMV
jgi:hypothetical protein